MLNIKGEVEMDALVMDGQTLASGAVVAVRNIANPIQLSRLVMEKVRRRRSFGTAAPLHSFLCLGVPENSLLYNEFCTTNVM